MSIIDEVKIAPKPLNVTELEEYGREYSGMSLCGEHGHLEDAMDSVVGLMFLYAFVPDARPYIDQDKLRRLADRIAVTANMHCGTQWPTRGA